MFRQIASLFSSVPQPSGTDTHSGAFAVAHNLFGQANVRAGHNAAEARELRAAAFAYLSVIR